MNCVLEDGNIIRNCFITLDGRFTIADGECESYINSLSLNFTLMYFTYISRSDAGKNKSKYKVMFDTLEHIKPSTCTKHNSYL